MPAASVASAAFRQLARGVHRSLAEWLRIAAVYLGIAVIVTVSMGFALPGLREQALQVLEALLTALAPTGASGSTLDADAAATAVALAVPATPATNATGFLTPVKLEPPAPPPRPRGDGTATSAQTEALRNYISRKYKVASDATSVLVQTAYKAGQDMKVDPLLLLAVMAIESSYNPFAESSMGAQGLMQVITSVHRAKFAPYGKDGPLNPVANIKVGASILKECIGRRGSVRAGLACYNGATDTAGSGYADKELAERRRLAVASGIPLARE